MDNAQPHLKVILKSDGLTYGDTKLKVDIELDVGGATALIGPNMAGKSLALHCIAARSRRLYARAMPELPPELDCRVEPDLDYYAVLVDAYRVMAQAYEKLLEKPLGYISSEAEELKNYSDERIRAAGYSIGERVVDISKAAGGDHLVAKELKLRARDTLLWEAGQVFRDLVVEFEKASERLREEVREVFTDYAPLLLSAVEEGFVWEDLAMGARGRRLGQLSSVFAPALVALYAAYTYALGEAAYLLVEEPEAHAHPLYAFFLGRYLRRLVERSGGRFNVVAATHSLDFVRGLGGRTYVLRRSRERGIYVAGEWKGEAYVPGFSDPAIYQLFGGV
ncbi:hypothetical protein [Pyrobaculum neutrophilum]|uniref:ATPase AAA-type core domain-containing protein n=1 Tax=Pyrobaculum neutrophilum (strain DSM 2338 / JCM 9278 / NBRC 100436 / V24Sta) TaxID=444157 RepID=B1Y8J8_PYRNV|nr:hypothetical protein [Pyrobaculum neutrophilum]ACB40077.1 conserved hypothetical protein [Pyrobaculum neutrophilum V24Sta]